MILSAILLCCSAVSARAGENYALLVAVQDYDEKELRPLQFTRADILDFQKALVESGFKPANVIVLHDDLAKLVAHYQALGRDYNPKDYLPEAAKIRKQLELVLGLLQKEDSLVVAFTGHGVQFAKENKSYFCPSDAKLDDKDSLISLDEIYAHLKDCEAARKLLLVDACQNDPQSRIGKARRSVDLDSVTRPQSEPVPEGIIALFSCRAGQQSFEHPPLGHGIFFHHVLDGWKGKADLNGDSRLSYLELAQYAEKQTAEYAYLKLKVSQKPQLKAEFSGDWVLRELSRPSLAPPLFDATRARTSAEAKAAQDAWAKHLGTTPEVEGALGLKLRLIPPGEFRRGTTGFEAAAVQKLDLTFQDGRTDAEQPQHTVRISKPLLLGAMEITRGQFRRFVSATGYATEAETDGRGGLGYDASTGSFEQRKEYSWKNTGYLQTDDHPAVNVTWNDANAFCKWISREVGSPYRLPTEAEWEYACRAGTQTRYHSGDDPETLATVGNVADASLMAKFSSEAKLAVTGTAAAIAANDGFVFTAPVGRFRANGFGLFDMHGNAWEWCSTAYDPKEYAQYAGRTTVDPLGPQSSADRVLRGGSWFHAPQAVRTSLRGAYVPAGRVYDLGFRVASVP